MIMDFKRPWKFQIFSSRIHGEIPQKSIREQPFDFYGGGGGRKTLQKKNSGSDFS